MRLHSVGVSARVYGCGGGAGDDIAPVPELRVVNAECVLEDSAFQEDLRSGNLYDCILSAETFRHFQDPLGALCQLFPLLRPGGVLAVDRLNARGLGSCQHLLDWWRRAGVEVHGVARFLDCLCVTSTSPRAA